MANDKPQEFPDVGSKLGAPTKKSLFERQKAEAEAKRLKEQQETAAVYEDFVKSFDDDGDGDSLPGGARPAFAGSSGLSGGFSKRHFTGPPSRAGRGSGPGSLGPSGTSLPKKRGYDGDAPSRGMFAYEDKPSSKAAFDASDDEDESGAASSRAQEKAVHKPTLHLSSLPPGISLASIKSIIPSNVKVDNVRIIQSSASRSSDRRGQTALVTMAADTPAGDLDTIVSTLQNKYLGRGFYLSLSRHLSSAVAASLPSATASASLPFGAKPAQLPPGRGGGYTRPGQRGGFAPPPGYGSSSYGRPPPMHVSVAPPADLKQLKLIHKTVESLVKHGPEFEALLMSRPEVQFEERWAWLWDPTSVGGVWYRWRLWDILTAAKSRQRKAKRGANDGQSQIVFDGGAPWTAPEQRLLPFEYATAVDEFVSDEDYDSSSDDESGDEKGRRRLNHLQGGLPLPENAGAPDAVAAAVVDEIAYLNPLHKAKLVHLLSRLPDTTAKLRRGDVARVTAFAIQHAGEGADEVADLLVSNVRQPFSLAIAKTQQQHQVQEKGESNDTEDNDAEDSEAGSKQQQQQQQNSESAETDPSQHKLVSLYLISDILSSSSTSGVRHAWRYRQLFETSLREQATFAHLGRVEKELRWGRLRAEKWRRSVGAVLSLWEGWCVFPNAAHEGFVDEFASPPLTEDEKREAEKMEEEGRAKERARSKWKSVQERKEEEEEKEGREEAAAEDMDVDGRPMEEDGDVDGEEMEDLDGEPMEDLDGEPMEGVDGEPMDQDADGEAAVGDAGADAETKPADAHPVQQDDAAQTTESSTGGKRRRPRAEDMFADSDGE